MHIYKEKTDLLYCTSESGSDIALSRVFINPYRYSWPEKPKLDLVFRVDSLAERRNNLVNLILSYKQIVKLRDHISDILNRLEVASLSNVTLKNSVEAARQEDERVPKNLRDYPTKP